MVFEPIFDQRYQYRREYQINCKSSYRQTTTLLYFTNSKLINISDKIINMRRNQLKKMTLDEIMLHLQTETDPDSIKLITAFINEKNTALTERKNILLTDIADIRVKLQKSIKNLNGRVKDRIDKKETVIMDKDSRPTPATITELMALFSYLQNQGRIITRNSLSIAQAAESAARLTESLREKVQFRSKYDQLDQQFNNLNSECQKEEAVRDALLKQRDQKRRHYANIDASIEAYRRDYQKVEGELRTKERELIQLSTYYNARLGEDKSILQQLPLKSLEYQSQLLRAQEELNACRALLEQRRMLKIQEKGGH